MSLQPCSLHGTPVPGVKLATLFAAWHNEEGIRQAYKLKLCANCLTTVRASLLKFLSPNSPNLTVCPACEADSSADLSPIYLTLYVPKQEGREFALATCGSCATGWRGTFSESGQLQPDRFAGERSKTGWEEFEW